MKKDFFPAWTFFFLVSFYLVLLYPLIVFDLEVNRKLVRCACVVTLPYFLFSDLVSLSVKILQPVDRIMSHFIFSFQKSLYFMLVV